MAQAAARNDRHRMGGDRRKARRSISVELTQLLDQSSKIGILLLTLFAIIAALHFGSYVFAPVLAGVLLGFTIGPVVDYLERRHIPPMLSSGMIVLTLSAAIILLALALSQPIATWSARIPEIGTKFQDELARWRAPIDRLQQMEKNVEKAAEPAAAENKEARPVEVVVQKRGVVSNLLTSAPDGLARFALFLGTLYFLLATRSRLRISMMGGFATRRSKFRLARIIRDTEFLLSRYIFTITGINIVLGLLVVAMTYAVGLPSPMLWGAMAGVLNFIPYIGMASMTIVLAGVGLVTFDTVGQALLPALIYLGMNALEGQFVTPMMLGRNLTLNPLIVFLSIAFWLWLWGPLGAFLAVPLLIIATATLYHLAPRLVEAGQRPSFGKPAASAAAVERLPDEDG